MHQWHYELDGKPTGPVKEAELRRLYTKGTIKDKTLVWREGLPNWQPYRDTFGGEEPSAPATEATRCAHCGNETPETELVSILELQVCANCKPTVLQSLREGIAPEEVFSKATAWRGGKYLVVRHGTSELPRRCLKCNLTHGLVSHERKVTVFVPSMSPLKLFQGLRVKFFLCAGHQRRRFWKRLIGISSLALAFLTLLSPLPPTVITVIMVTAMVIAILCLESRMAVVRKATETGVWLEGAGKPFLEPLPEWRE